MFQAKSQDLEWAFGFSGSNNSLSESLEVKVSKNGDVYKLGSFHDSMDFNILNNGNQKDFIPKSKLVKTIFLTKYDANLNLKWVKLVYGNQGLSEIIRCSMSNIDVNGNITLGVTFSDSIEIEGLDTVVKSTGEKDFVLIQYNSIGNVNWMRHYEGKGVNEIEKQIVIDPYKNIYISGYFSDSFYLGEIDNNRNKIYYDAKQKEFLFIAKLDSLGKTIWFKPIECSSYCKFRNLILDSKQDIVAIGFYNDSLFFDNSNILLKNRNSTFDLNSFIVKYSNEGSFKWTNWIESEKVKDNYLYGLAIDRDDNIYTSGYFLGEITLRNNQTSFEKFNNKNYNLLLSKYKSNGTYLWSKIMTNGRRNSFRTELAIDENNVYLAGEFADSLETIDTENNTWTIKSNNIRTTFLSFLDFDGKVISLFPLNDLNPNYINNSSSLSDIALQNNAIIISGNFAGEVDFDPTKKEKKVISNYAMFNSYFAKYSLNPINRDSLDQKPPTSSIINPSSNNLSIYPNPFTDKIYIDNPKAAHYNIVIHDLLGKAIYSSPNIQAKTHVISLNPSLPKGLYFVEIETANFKKISKMIKE